MHVKTAAGLLVIGTLGIGLTACGASDGSGAAASSPQGIQAGQGTAKARAITAADAAVKRLGTAELPAVTVGLNQIVGAAEPAQRAQNALERAARVLGWKVIVCDAQGDPTKMANCETSLLNQGVKALFSIGEESSVIAAGLRQAKARGIPTFNFGGQVTPSPLFTGNYGPDEAKAGRVLGAWIARKLQAIGGGQIIRSTYPAIYSTRRDSGLLAEVKADPGLKLPATTTIDAANMVAGTRQQVTSMLTQHPEAKVYWSSFEASIQPAAQAVATVAKGRRFPQAPLVVTFHADLGTQQLIRQGLVDAVADNPYDASAWAAVDSAAEYLARHRANPSPGYTVAGFALYDYPIITKEKLPPEGHYVTPANDFVTFFSEKWKREFGR